MDTNAVINKQLYDQILEITPETCESVFHTLKELLAAHEPTDAFYKRLWKALFMGLWNYDKMINQHYLSTDIAEIVHLLDQRKALKFLQVGFSTLEKYWSRIDHHRINKFMKLHRYLLRQAMICLRKKKLLNKIPELLKQCIFVDLANLSGLSMHTLDIYIETLQEAQVPLKMKHLEWIQQLFRSSNNKEFREYIIIKVYEQIKSTSTPQTVGELKNMMMAEAQKAESEEVRKSFYDAYGYLRSNSATFLEHKERKRENLEKEGVQRARKKISKGKKQEVEQLKEKRQQRKKKDASKFRNKQKILSKQPLEMQNQ